MLFNSLDFLIFLPVVVLAFYLFPQKFRVFLLLAASYFFYLSWNPIYIVLILFSTLVDYSAGRILNLELSILKRKLTLWTSLCMNLGLLAIFKYGDFIFDTLNRGFYKFGYGNIHFDALNLILPVGISFYTFQTMSYMIDVYNRKIKAENNLAYFALYVSYFPQLVAGPIERFSNLIDQLKAKVVFLPSNIEKGIYSILFGFFMKLVIADSIGWYIDEGFSLFSQDPSLNLMWLVLLYPIQIYCDFHGYTTIAIGAAQMMGVKLSVNFRGPFWSTNLTQFWRKWHISLTTWFRDYVYFPLGGNKYGWLKTSMAIMIVFLVSGLWHGANWTFIIWGIGHGLIVLFEKLIDYQKLGEKIIAIKILKGILNYGIVAVLFVYFRSPSVGAANDILSNLSDFKSTFLPDIPITTLVLLMLFIFSDFGLRNTSFVDWILVKNRYIIWGICAFLLFIIMSNSGTNQQPFIYFQF